MSGIGETYECEICHATFTKTRSDEAAEAERKATWRPVENDTDTGVICHVCFLRVLTWAAARHQEYLR